MSINTMPRRKRTGPVPPDEPITTSVRMVGAVYNALMAAAEREDRSLNAQIGRVLREWAEQQEKAEKRARAKD